MFAAIYDLLKELSRLLDFGMNLLLRLLVGESVAVEDRVPESVDPGKEVACVIDGTRGLPVDNHVHGAGVGVKKFALNIWHRRARGAQRHPAGAVDPERLFESS